MIPQPEIKLNIKSQHSVNGVPSEISSIPTKNLKDMLEYFLEQRKKIKQEIKDNKK